ncbi:MAG: hypothetical protein P1V20_12510 [Verrucomicrobiales bacterium]|nr:hypothetical protein [Verrucomicrobiales bacterium]
MQKVSVFFLLFVGITLVQVSSYGQNTDNGESSGLNGFWEIETAGGRFVVRLDQISCVSQHEYLIDGSVKVYECTVATDGGQIGRFYYIEPVGGGAVTGTNTYNRLKDISNKVTNRAGMGDAEHIVTKHYPDTTHAKTSEYRFKYKDTIGRIYDHVHRVWAQEKGRGKGNKITISE